MKYFIRIVNAFIILVIPAVIIRTDASNNIVKVDSIDDVKYVKSIALPQREIKKEEPLKEVEPVYVAPVIEKKQETTQPVSTTPNQQSNDIIRTLVGSMSGYGPDCAGCGGHTATGHNLYASIYYNDPTYGNVRVLAGDRSLPFGSIIRIKNSKIGEFLGIVLDRGGAIGIGRRHLFDLAFDSEANAYQYGVSYNVTFEVIREGY